MEPTKPGGVFAAMARTLSKALHIEPEPAEYVPGRQPHSKAVLRRRAKNRVARRSRRVNRLRAKR